MTYPAVLFAVLPALLFEAAWNLSRESVRRTWFLSFMLAFPGVFVSALLIAAGMVFIGHLTWASALLFGAIVAATDPIAVVAIVRRLRAPDELRTTIEVESLVNDGVAAVLYTIMVANALGSRYGTGATLATFFLMTLGGGVIGYAFAQLAALALRRSHTAWLHALVTIALAYGAFALAQRMGLSGIIAAIVGAYVLGTQELTFVDVRMHAAVDRLWRVLALLANLIVFVSMGIAISLRDLAAHGAAAGVAVLTVVAVRIIVVGGLLPIVARVPKNWVGPLILAGMRGALSLALAMSLPASIPDRALIIDAVAAVVVATLLLPALFMAPWLRLHPPAASY